jgi:hypothetical protein
MVHLQEVASVSGEWREIHSCLVPKLSGFQTLFGNEGHEGYALCFLCFLLFKSERLRAQRDARSPNAASGPEAMLSTVVAERHIFPVESTD